MPLIECFDCQKMISDMAPACTHCGRPIMVHDSNSTMPSSSRVQAEATAPADKPRRVGRPKTAIHVQPNRLKELRERHKKDGGFWLTTAEVSRATGIDEGTVSRQENHERGLTNEQVEAYAQLYKVRPQHLFANLTVEP